MYEISRHVWMKSALASDHQLSASPVHRYVELLDPLRQLSLLRQLGLLGQKMTWVAQGEEDRDEVHKPCRLHRLRRQHLVCQFGYLGVSDDALLGAML